MPPTPAESEKQLSGFIAKFEPKLQTLIRSVRAALRKRFPTANELVYDNYNFFVIGYCTTERASDCIVSIAAAANGVAVCFTYGAKLPDPKKVLVGAGKQTRFLRLNSADVLRRPEVETLLAQAASAMKTPLSETGAGKLVIRSISAKQRPRKRSSKI